VRIVLNRASSVHLLDSVAEALKGFWVDDFQLHRAWVDAVQAGDYVDYLVPALGRVDDLLSD
jgi:hypothetical protein